MSEDGRLYISRTKAILTREQKTGLGMVIGFGALAFIFGGFYMWKHMASPFVLSYTGSQFLTGDEKREKEMEKLQKEDTDGDGLNDYEELYIYATSPYIADSDSDGVNDNAEIVAGDDPNCAPGMPCDAVDMVNPATLKGTFAEEIAVDTMETMAANESGAESSLSGDMTGTDFTSEDIMAALNEMSPDDIRQLLIDSGGDPTEVNALTDDELWAVLFEVMQTAQSEESAEIDTSIYSETSGH